jgi:uracil-DNA glycosylase
MGVDDDTFYDRDQIAIVPMAFCFPGYDAKGSDLPPPKICGQTWHDRVMSMLGRMPLTILVGGHAHKYHLNVKIGVTETVENWEMRAPDVFALPHPSWRNTGWIKKNPWFEIDTLPALRARVKEVLT